MTMYVINTVRDLFLVWDHSDEMLNYMWCYDSQRPCQDDSRVRRLTFNRGTVSASSLKMVRSMINWPAAQVPKCTSHIYHNVPFCNRNVHMCAHFCYKAVYFRIYVQCGICEMGILFYDDVMTWTRFLHYWPCEGNERWQVDFPKKSK